MKEWAEALDEVYVREVTGCWRWRTLETQDYHRTVTMFALRHPELVDMCGTVRFGILFPPTVESEGVASPVVPRLDLCSGGVDVRIDPTGSTPKVRVIPACDVVRGASLGAGGFARVFAGRWNGAVVALKCFDGANASGTAPTDEAALLMSLCHPGIVRVYGVTAVGLSSCVNCVVLDVEGLPLLKWVSCVRPRSRAATHAASGAAVPRCDSVAEFHAKLCDVLAQIASALAHCHAQSPPIVHCDVKPNNILVRWTPTDTTCRGVLVDFGLALVGPCGPSPDGHRPRVRGTARYLSPEAWRGVLSDVATPTDVYSLGVTAIAAFTGTVRWNGQPELDINSKAGWRWIRSAVTSGVTPVCPTPYPEDGAHPPTLADVCNCPAEVLRVIQACLVGDPAGRPTAFSVCQDLCAVRDKLRGHLSL